MRAAQRLGVEQRTVLRTLGGWAIADALIDPTRGCTALRTGMWGGTYSHHGQRAHFDCTQRGIVVYTYVPAKGRDVDGEPAFDQAELVAVRWAELTRYAASLSAAARNQLCTARADLQRAWLAVCGPLPPAGQRPAERDPDELEALRQAHRAATRRLDDALRAALPLDEVPEQLDLFAAC